MLGNKGLQMKNLTAALILSGAAFVSLSSAETVTPSSHPTPPVCQPAGAAAVPITSPLTRADLPRNTATGCPASSITVTS